MKLKQCFVLVLLWALFVLTFIDFDLNAGMNNPGGVGGEVFTNANNRFTTNSSQLYEFGAGGLGSVNTFVWSNIVNKAKVEIIAGGPLDDRTGMIGFFGSNGVFGVHLGVLSGGSTGGFQIRTYPPEADRVYLRFDTAVMEIGPSSVPLLDLGSGMSEIRCLGNSEANSEVFITTNRITFGLNASYLETHNGIAASFPNGWVMNSGVITIPPSPTGTVTNTSSFTTRNTLTCSNFVCSVGLSRSVTNMVGSGLSNVCVYASGILTNFFTIP